MLESVAPGAAVTATADGNTPAEAAPGVATADAQSAENRLLWRVQPSDLEKTVLVKDQAKRDVTKDSAAVKDSPIVQTRVDSPPSQ